MSADMPEYSDLPELGELGVRHSWGVLPEQAGALSFTEPAHVVAAAQQVTSGVTIPLNLAVDAFDPPLFGRDRLRHRVVEASRLDAEDIIDAFNPQSSTQLDGLAHVRAREHGYYGGITELDEARERLGMHHWAQRGIAGRAVLLDVVRYWEQQGRNADPFMGTEITADDLRAVIAAQGVELRRGDVVLIRTGWAERFLALDATAREAVTGWNGLRADEQMAAFFWNTGIALVGSDNPAVENAPGSREVGSLHRRLLPSLGLTLMELLDFSKLAPACESESRWEFFFVSVPLHLRGAVSSPANAMAIL